MDVVLATVAGQVPDLAGTPAKGGRIVALNGSDVEAVQRVSAQGLRADFMLVEPDRSDLESLTALMENGRLTVHVDRVFPLSEVSEAHRLGEQGRTTGKIALVP